MIDEGKYPYEWLINDKKKDWLEQSLIKIQQAYNTTLLATLRAIFR